MTTDESTLVGPDVMSFFQRAYAALRALVEGLDDDALAWRPAPGATPIANVVLHVLGATRASFTVAIGAPEERDREAEFTAAPLSSAELVERIDAAGRELDRFGLRLTTADLVATRPRPARTQTWTGLQVLLNAYGHVTEHMGHVALTRQIWELRREGSQS
jgi:hypothetical protein